MVRLSFLELQILVALDDRKTLTQIGDELFLKHPSVSRALHGAEQKAGVALTEQVGRRLRLTSAGVELAARARDVLTRYDDLERMVQDLRDGEAGSVRVIATRTGCAYLLPGVLRRFVVTFNRANISLEVATPDEVWRRFLDERYDVALAPRTHDMPAYADWLFDDQDALYVHPSDALVQAARQSPMHLTTLVAPLAREPERQVDDHLRRRHVTFGRRLDIRNLEAAKHLVEAGIGAGLFSRSTVTREIAENRLTELSWLDLDIQTSWYFGVFPGSRRAPLVDHIVSLIEAEAASWRHGDLYAGRTGHV